MDFARQVWGWIFTVCGAAFVLAVAALIVNEIVETVREIRHDLRK